MREEECQLPGCRLMGVTCMHCIHSNVRTILGTQAEVQRDEMEVSSSGMEASMVWNGG